MASPLALPAPPLPSEQLPVSASPVKNPSGSYAGGAGGKLRDRRASAQRKKTPYDRPSSGRHAVPGGASLFRLVSGSDTSGSSIASRLVGSASRLLSSSALLLYSSIFNRRPRLNSDSGEGGQLEEGLKPGSPLVQVEAVDSHNEVPSGGDIAEKKEDESELLEVEEILKRKMLSREQFNRLTDILQSRIVDNKIDGQSLLRDNKPREEGDLPRSGQQESTPQSEAQRWREDRKKAREEKGNPLWGIGLNRNEHLKISDGGCSTPVEIARAFMGERTARSSGSVLSVHGHARPEQLPMQSGELWQHGDWVPEGRFQTPGVQTWGHDPGALRTPYRRSYFPPSVETTDTVLSRWTPIHIPITGGRERLKRRSSVLDDGWAIGGPSRRTRPKTLAVTASNNILNARGMGSAGIALPQLAAASVGLKSQTAAKRQIERNNGALPSQLNDDKKAVTSSLVSVPVQSSETARRILETLEKMTPSPKGKSLEEELILVRERPPTELTASMLNDHARKSMEVIDFPVQESDDVGPSRSEFENESPGFATSGRRTREKTRSKGKEEMSSAPGPASELQEEKAPFIDSESFPVQVFKSEKLIGDERSVSKVDLRVLSNINASEAVKGEGFRMNAVFEESNSDDEVRLNIKGAISREVESPNLSTPVSSDSVITFSMAPDPSFGGKELEFPAGSTDSFCASSADPAMTNMGSTFTFPFASSPGATSEPPSPKPLLLPSSFTGAISGSFPAAEIGMPSFGNKGSIFSFVGSTGSEQATKKVDTSEKNSELVFSSAAATASSLLSFTSGQVLPDSKPSVYTTNAVPIQLSSSVSQISTFSSSLSTGVVSQVSQASSLGLSSKPGTPAVLSSSLNFSSPTLFSQLASQSSLASSPFGGPSATTDNGSFNAVSSSLLFGASHTASGLFSPSSSFGQQKIPSQLGSMGSAGQEASFSIGTVGEVGRPQKRSFPVAEQDTGKRSYQFAAIGNGSTGSTTAVSTMSAGIAPTSISYSSQLFSGSVQSTVPAFTQSSQALTSSVSAISSSAFGTTTSSASSLLVSSSFPSSPLIFGGTLNSKLSSTSGISVFDTSASSTLQHSGSLDTFGGSQIAFGAESSSFRAGSSASFGATIPTFGTSSSNFVTTSSFAFGAPTVPAFGLSNSPFGSSTAKPFGIFTGDSKVETTSASTPAFNSGFAMGSIGFGSSFSSSSTIAFGASLASSPAENNLSFGSSSSISSSPFSFGTKESPALPQLPLFGSSSFGSSASVVATGDTSTNDQMEDSMAEEPPQMVGNVTPQIPIFGVTPPVPSPVPALATANFVFGAQPNTPTAGQSVFTFGAQPISNSYSVQGSAIQNPFAQPANLDYGGGGFSLGASGGEKSGRKFIKAKRAGGAKRGR